MMMFSRGSFLGEMDWFSGTMYEGVVTVVRDAFF